MTEQHLKDQALWWHSTTTKMGSATTKKIIVPEITGFPEVWSNDFELFKLKSLYIDSCQTG